ncbi:MAG: alcohol dehydrogenase catalytic domain-containing protein [Flavonifractor plautii]
MDTMNALVWKGDGALSLERRPIPALQGPRDAIVRVTRSTICTSDLHIRSGAVPRARPGVVLGHEFVGVVEAVGNGISNLRPGDRVAACSRELLRRLLVLPPGLCQQLHPRRLGARSPHRRLSGRVRPGALRRYRPHPHPGRPQR